MPLHHMSNNLYNRRLIDATHVHEEEGDGSVDATIYLHRSDQSAHEITIPGSFGADGTRRQVVEKLQEIINLISTTGPVPLLSSSGEPFVVENPPSIMNSESALVTHRVDSQPPLGPQSDCYRYFLREELVDFPFLSDEERAETSIRAIFFASFRGKGPDGNDNGEQAWEWLKRDISGAMAPGSRYWLFIEPAPPLFPDPGGVNGNNANGNGIEGHEDGTNDHESGYEGDSSDGNPNRVNGFNIID
ncbi:hypothetical protein PMIN04_002990 [Paraphaeosphaeria minitans]